MLLLHVHDSHSGTARHDPNLCIPVDPSHVECRQIVKVGDPQKMRVFLEFVIDTDTLVACCRDEWLSIYDQEVRCATCVQGCHCQCHPALCCLIVCGRALGRCSQLSTRAAATPAAAARPSSPRSSSLRGRSTQVCWQGVCSKPQANPARALQPHAAKA